MTMNRAYFEHCGEINGRPPVEAYEIEASYQHQLLMDLRQNFIRYPTATVEEAAWRFAATARRLRWQAGIRREHGVMQDNQFATGVTEWETT